MPKYITATEAARRLGVNEKTVRTWISGGKLAARKAEKNRFDILAADVESLRRKREGYQEYHPDISLLVARVEDLERKYADLEQKYVGLSSAVAEAEVKSSRKRSPDENEAASVDIPDGSMLFADFAAKHGVPRGTFSHHVKHGVGGDVLPTIKRPKPGRPEHTEYWLTPDQQMAALAYWDRHNVLYNRFDQ